MKALSCTVHGYDYNNLKVAFECALRDGDEQFAAFCAAEMDQFSKGNAAFNLIFTSIAKYVGIGKPSLIPYTLRCYKNWERCIVNDDTGIKGTSYSFLSQDAHTELLRAVFAVCRETKHTTNSNYGLKVLQKYPTPFPYYPDTIKKKSIEDSLNFISNLKHEKEIVKERNEKQNLVKEAKNRKKAAAAAATTERQQHDDDKNQNDTDDGGDDDTEDHSEPPLMDIDVSRDSTPDHNGEEKKKSRRQVKKGVKNELDAARISYSFCQYFFTAFRKHSQKIEEACLYFANLICTIEMDEKRCIPRDKENVAWILTTLERFNQNNDLYSKITGTSQVFTGRLIVLFIKILHMALMTEHKHKLRDTKSKYTVQIKNERKLIKSEDDPVVRAEIETKIKTLKEERRRETQKLKDKMNCLIQYIFSILELIAQEKGSDKYHFFLIILIVLRRNNLSLVNVRTDFEQEPAFKKALENWCHVPIGNQSHKFPKDQYTSMMSCMDRTKPYITKLSNGDRTASLTLPHDQVLSGRQWNLRTDRYRDISAMKGNSKGRFNGFASQDTREILYNWVRERYDDVDIYSHWGAQEILKSHGPPRYMWRSIGSNSTYDNVDDYGERELFDPNCNLCIDIHESNDATTIPKTQSKVVEAKSSTFALCHHADTRLHNKPPQYLHLENNIVADNESTPASHMVLLQYRGIISKLNAKIQEKQERLESLKHNNNSSSNNDNDDVQTIQQVQTLSKYIRNLKTRLVNIEKHSKFALGFFQNEEEMHTSSNASEDAIAKRRREVWLKLYGEQPSCNVMEFYTPLCVDVDHNNDKENSTHSKKETKNLADDSDWDIIDWLSRPAITLSNDEQLKLWEPDYYKKLHNTRVGGGDGTSRSNKAGTSRRSGGRHHNNNNRSSRTGFGVEKDEPFPISLDQLFEAFTVSPLTEQEKTLFSYSHCENETLKTSEMQALISKLKLRGGSDDDEEKNEILPVPKPVLVRRTIDTHSKDFLRAEDQKKLLEILNVKSLMDVTGKTSVDVYVSPLAQKPMGKKERKKKIHILNDNNKVLKGPFYPWKKKSDAEILLRTQRRSRILRDVWHLDFATRVEFLWDAQCANIYMCFENFACTPESQWTRNMRQHILHTHDGEVVSILDRKSMGIVKAHDIVDQESFDWFVHQSLIYLVACYLLGVGSMNLSNILINADKKILGIDYEENRTKEIQPTSEMYNMEKWLTLKQQTPLNTNQHSIPTATQTSPSSSLAALSNTTNTDTSTLGAHNVVSVSNTLDSDDDSDDDDDDSDDISEAEFIRDIESVLGYDTVMEEEEEEENNVKNRKSTKRKTTPKRQTGGGGKKRKIESSKRNGRKNNHTIGTKATSKKPLENESCLMLFDMLFNKRPNHDIRLQLGDLIRKYSIHKDIEQFLSFVEENMDNVPYKEWHSDIEKKVGLIRQALDIITF